MRGWPACRPRIPACKHWRTIVRVDLVSFIATSIINTEFRFDTNRFFEVARPRSAGRSSRRTRETKFHSQVGFSANGFPLASAPSPVVSAPLRFRRFLPAHRNIHRLIQNQGIFGKFFLLRRYACLYAYAYLCYNVLRTHFRSILRVAVKLAMQWTNANEALILN